MNTNPTWEGRERNCPHCGADPGTTHTDWCPFTKAALEAGDTRQPARNPTGMVEADHPIGPGVKIRVRNLANAPCPECGAGHESHHEVWCPVVLRQASNLTGTCPGCAAPEGVRHEDSCPVMAHYHPEGQPAAPTAPTAPALYEVRWLRLIGALIAMYFFATTVWGGEGSKVSEAVAWAVLAVVLTYEGFRRMEARP